MHDKKTDFEKINQDPEIKKKLEFEITELHTTLIIVGFTVILRGFEFVLYY